MLVKLDHFHEDRGEKKKYLKPPPRPQIEPFFSQSFRRIQTPPPDSQRIDGRKIAFPGGFGHCSSVAECRFQRTQRWIHDHADILDESTYPCVIA